MPTLEDDAPTIEPNEVEVGCGQAEVETYWALVRALFLTPTSTSGSGLPTQKQPPSGSSATGPTTGLTNLNDDGLVIKSPKDY